MRDNRRTHLVVGRDSAARPGQAEPPRCAGAGEPAARARLFVLVVLIDGASLDPRSVRLWPSAGGHCVQLSCLRVTAHLSLPCLAKIFLRHVWSLSATRRSRTSRHFGGNNGIPLLAVLWEYEN